MRAAVAILTTAALAPAQVERYELGWRFRMLEAAAAQHTTVEERARIADDIDRALRGFFGMDLRRACAAIDRARLELATAAPDPVDVWAASLVLNTPAQLVDADTLELACTLEAFYETDVPPPEGAVLEIGGVRLACTSLPVHATIDLRPLGPGDHRIQWSVRAGDRVLVRRARGVSIVRDLDARIGGLLDAETAASTESSTARALAKLCRALSRPRTQEVDFPAARLLDDAERAMRAAAAGERFWDASRPGEHWMRVETAAGAVRCRIAVPPDVDEDAPPPLVIAMHGAGGSENLFFEGENSLTPSLCAARGWYLVAPRSSPLGPPPLPALLDALAERYPFDRARVFVIGHSMGAMQGLAAACRDPARFRAVAALGGGGPVRAADGLDRVAFWIGVGARDFAAPGARRTADALAELGAQTTFHELEGVGHVLVLQDTLADVFAFFDGQARSARPNFLVIVADDLGYCDLGFLGSEIATPNLDALARDGLVMTRFMVSPTCSPTRASLLTGMDPHAAGLGTMAGCALGAQIGAPGYAGRLRSDVPTVATLLQDAGYHTSIAGKWHLGADAATAPHRRGFERSFVLLPGGASHFADATALHPPDLPAPYTLDGVPAELPDDFYSTTAYTDRVLEFVGEALDDGRPFFACATYTAPHWPLQVPDDWLGRCEGRYDDGYDVLRARRFERAKRLGLVPESARLPASLATPWSELDDEERAISARTMEIYAAMVEHLDHQVGRIVRALEAKGALESTVVLFFPDNGPEGNPIDRLGRVGTWLPRRFDNSLDNVGRADSYVWPGPGWAQASVAPFRLFKSFPTEGGVRVPAIVRGPIAARGRCDATVTVADVAPTLLELAGVPVPPGMTGRSARALLAGDAEAVHGDDDAIAYELFGRRAVRRGRWKALWLWPPYGTGAWQLYDVEADPAESRDLAQGQPEVLRDLVEVWSEWADAQGVVLPPRDAGYALVPR